MRRIAIGLLVAGVAFGADAVRHVTFKAVATKVEDHTSANSFTLPGNQQTTCTGSSNTVGGSTVGAANCQTTGTPAQTIPYRGGYTTIFNQVEADGFTYLLGCNTSPFRACSMLIIGDSFPAEIKGTDVVVTGPRGGNMGKMVKVKFRLLDMRPTAEAKPLN